MKTRTHFLLGAFALVAVGITGCSKTSVSHDADSLPEKARTTLAQNFTAAVTLVKSETNVGSTTEYDVTLSNGTEIVFRGNGEWDSVETPNDIPVPSGMIPTAIADYVKEKHTGALIVGIDKERTGYEVDLSNGVELSFDKDGNIIPNK